MARQGKARVFSFGEFKKAEAAALTFKHGDRNRVMLYLSFGLGLRACEIRRLKIEDLIDARGELQEEVLLEKGITKGGKQRQVYLTNPILREILVKYINTLKKTRSNIVNLSQHCNKQFLFNSQKGRPFYPNNIVRIFHQIFKKAGLDGAKSHSGRRTFISKKIDEGVNLKLIADLVGHGSIQTTVGYYDSNPTRLKKIAEKSIF